MTLHLKYPRRQKRTISGKTYRISPPSEKRSNIMAKISSQNTSIEGILATALRTNKIKYRNGKKIYGKPDFILYKKKIAIFCDGDFWHGYKYKKGKKNISKTNSKFWKAKIGRNIDRDKEVNNVLKKHGWKIVRLWEHQIKRDINWCITKIEKTQ